MRMVEDEDYNEVPPWCRIPSEELTISSDMANFTRSFNGPSDRMLFEDLITHLLSHTSLPSDVIRCVLWYLNDETRLIHTLSLVSRSLNHLANVLLYRCIVFDWKDHRSNPPGFNPPAELLLRSFLGQPRHLDLVRSISLVGQPLCLWRHDTQSNPDSPWTYRLPNGMYASKSISFDLQRLRPEEKHSFASACDQLGVADSLLPSLVLPVLLKLVASRSPLMHLRIDSDFFFADSFRDAFKEHVGSGKCSALQAIELATDTNADPEDNSVLIDVWEDLLWMPIALSRLHSLSLASFARALDISHRLHSNITSLRLLQFFDTCTMQTALDVLLPALPNLQKLEYRKEVMGDYELDRPEDWYENDIHCPALASVSRTLKHLRISEHIGLNLSHYEPFWYYWPEQSPITTRLKGLKNLTELVSLECPFGMLHGWIFEPDRVVPWRDLLPPSLRYITLTDQLTYESQFDWSNARILAMVQGLFQWWTSVAGQHDQLFFTFAADEVQCNLGLHLGLRRLSRRFGVPVQVLPNDLQKWRLPEIEAAELTDEVARLRVNA